MQLTTRLIMGYAVLAGLIVTMAALSTFGLYEVDRVTLPKLERQETIRNGLIDLIESLERLDSSLLAAMTEGQSDLEAFRRARKQVQNDINGLTDELAESDHQLFSTLESEWVELSTELDRFEESASSYSIRKYESEIFPVFWGVRNASSELLDRADARVDESHDSVRNAASRHSILIGVLVTVSLVTVLFLFFGLRRNLLDRLGKLAEFDRRIGDAEAHHRRIDLGPHDDELSHTARVINRLLDEVAQTRSAAVGRHAWSRQTALALMAFQDDVLVLLDLSGRLKLWHSDLSHATAKTLAASVSEALEEQDQDGSFEEPSLGVSLEPLESRSGPLGWLVRSGTDVEEFNARLGPQSETSAETGEGGADADEAGAAA